MAEMKHVGRVIASGRKCLVAFRTLPGDAYNCLIVPTENLTDSYHNSLMTLVESTAGQDAFEFADVMARSIFPDGENMLETLHKTGKLVKISTSEVEMLPTTTFRINLAELNQLIAEQRNISVDDLTLIQNKEPMNPQTEIQEVATVSDISPPMGEENLTADQRASKLRSEADRLYKEAAKLRKQAEELSPTKKKS
jgi:hypothetical protein